MHRKLFVIAVLCLASSAGGALAKGGPPAKGQKAQEKAAAAAAKSEAHEQKAQTKAAAKELKFKHESRTLGYSCRGGTTHLVGEVAAVTPSSDLGPGSLTITVTKGNKRGRALVDTELTIVLFASTQIIHQGQGTVADLVPGATVRIDARMCKPTEATTTDGVAPVPAFVARKVLVSG
jgi:hypothetical protein